MRGRRAAPLAAAGWMLGVASQPPASPDTSSVPVPWCSAHRLVHNLPNRAVPSVLSLQGSVTVQFVAL